jgi:hypothetical protein
MYNVFVFCKVVMIEYPFLFVYFFYLLKHHNDLVHIVNIYFGQSNKICRTFFGIYSGQGNQTNI